MISFKEYITEAKYESHSVLKESIAPNWDNPIYLEPPKDTKRYVVTSKNKDGKLTTKTVEGMPSVASHKYKLKRDGHTEIKHQVLKEENEPKDPALPLKIPPFKPWQRAVMRKSGSVKPGHWNGKKFISDLSKQDAPGFDHERCKSINAQIEVNGKVVAGEIQKPLDETSSWKDKKNIDKSKSWSQQVRNSVEKERKRLERIKNTKGYDAYLAALKQIE